MRFVSLRIKQGLFENIFNFPADINIIYSAKNSVGKTTLLRFLMYSLGYQIPSTRGINFSRFELLLNIVDDNGNDGEVYRHSDYITYSSRGETDSYSLPYDLHELHKCVFSIGNTDVLDNLLGAFYVDQEKGWTLLNRGKAIGNIHFNIERLLMGLSNRSCNDAVERLASVKRELRKYKQMFDIAQYQTEISALSEDVAFDTPAEELERKLDVLRSKRLPIVEELKRIEGVIRKNTSFKKYITSYKLYVVSKDGIRIPVNEDTIDGYQDAVNYLITKRQFVNNELTSIDRQIITLEEQKNARSALFNVQTMIQSFDKDISKIHIDARATQNVIKGLEKERKDLEDVISKSLQANNPIIGELHQTISSYALELGVDEAYVRPTNDYIFTSDLKSLSGAIFHKIVFAFKISYIQIIKKYTGTVLPIVLDSPSGREVERVSIKEMMTILSRDFSDHQIIIASIYRYDFPNANIIEIRNKLLTF